jgi:hypothetical protein
MKISIIADMGRKIPSLPKAELALLIQDMRDPATEDPYRTLVRHFAGDLAYDIASRLGEPTRRHLHINEDLATFTIEMEYPEEVQQKYQPRDMQKFIEDRKRYWLNQYETALHARVAACKDPAIRNGLKI